MRYNAFRVAAATGFLALLVSVGATAQGFPTPAERTDFQAGPTMYDDLMEFVHELDASSDLMQVRKITETLRGRDVVLSILSNPPVYQASDLIGSDKPIVLIVNNVHGGEVAGKEASLIIMRDLLYGDLLRWWCSTSPRSIPTVQKSRVAKTNRTST